MAQRYDILDVRMKTLRWDEGATARPGKSVAIPAWFDVELSHPDWKITVILSVVVDPDEGPRVTGIRSGDGGSYRDADALFRALDLPDDLISAATAQAAGQLAGWRAYALLPPSADADSPPEKVGEMLGKAVELVALRALSDPDIRPRRRRRMTRSLLREVAEVYRQALADGDAPTVAVRDHFHLSHSTAARWVGQARKIGELGPAAGPTPGELDIEEGDASEES